GRAGPGRIVLLPAPLAAQAGRMAVRRYIMMAGQPGRRSKRKPGWRATWCCRRAQRRDRRPRSFPLHRDDWAARPRSSLAPTAAHFLPPPQPRRTTAITGIPAEPPAVSDPSPARAAADSPNRLIWHADKGYGQITCLGSPCPQVGGRPADGLPVGGAEGRVVVDWGRVVRGGWHDGPGGLGQGRARRPA